MPRLRQVVLASGDLEATVQTLRDELGLGEPYRDPAVAYFGLANAVFAVGDGFLEVVSPVDLEQPGARTAARRLERAATPVCGYMAMVQVEDLAAARRRAAAAGVREVFEVELDDIAEVHLHPGDMRGAIVALSEPHPAGSWRWGGEGWAERSVEGSLSALTVAARDPRGVAGRWELVAGGAIPGCRFTKTDDPAAPGGIVELELVVGGRRRVLRPARLGHA